VRERDDAWIVSVYGVVIVVFGVFCISKSSAAAIRICIRYVVDGEWILGMSETGVHDVKFQWE
jgi:hypothetical protein